MEMGGWVDGAEGWSGEPECICLFCVAEYPRASAHTCACMCVVVFVQKVQVGIQPRKLGEHTGCVCETAESHGHSHVCPNIPTYTQQPVFTCIHLDAN